MNDNGGPSRVQDCFYPSGGPEAVPDPANALPGQQRPANGQPAAADQPAAVAPYVPPSNAGQTGSVAGVAPTTIGVNKSNSSRSHAAEHAARARALGKMDAAERQAIADLRALQIAKIRVLESMRTLKRGTYYADRRARLVDKLEQVQKELAQLDSEWEHADQIIEQTQREIDALNVRIKYAENAHAIERLKELQAKINNLKGG